jgi:hypothetical protein
MAQSSVIEQSTIANARSPLVTTCCRALTLTATSLGASGHNDALGAEDEESLLVVTVARPTGRSSRVRVPAVTLPLGQPRFPSAVEPQAIDVRAASQRPGWLGVRDQPRRSSDAFHPWPELRVYWTIASEQRLSQ